MKLSYVSLIGLVKFRKQMNPHLYSVPLICHIFLLYGAALICTGWGLSISSKLLENNQNIQYAKAVHSWWKRAFNYLICMSSCGFSTLTDSWENFAGRIQDDKIKIDLA